jgi:FkbM family methyltransferase
MTIQEQIKNIYTFCRKFGVNINGIRFLWKRRTCKNNQIITFSHKKLAHPIYFRGNNSDFTIFDQIFLNEEYLFDLDFQPKIILDCGANVGYATVFFKNKFPASKIICVEPDFSNFDILCENTKKFEDVILYKAGLWNKLSNLIIENPTGDKYGFIVKEVDTELDNTIKAITIDEIMKEQQIDFIDILKIDIEGSEKEVFSSNYEYWLSKTRMIIIELHDNIKNACSKTFFEALVKYNFSMAFKGENIIISLKNAQPPTTA